MCVGIFIVKVDIYVAVLCSFSLGSVGVWPMENQTSSLCTVYSDTKRRKKPANNYINN